MDELEDAIEKSRLWMSHCASLINGISIPSTNRARVSVSLHHLCIEHHTGIHTLVDHGVIGSAFALFRPQLDAYVRGAWVYFCAEDSQIQLFLDGKDPPRMDVITQQLESKGAFDGSSLSRMRKTVGRNLHDFTHGGAIQVKARNTRDEISQSYKPEHIAGMLHSSAILSQLAGVSIAAVVDSDQLASNLHDQYRSIYG